jgi:DNA-binding NarL/FixJ family response regulator
VLQIEDSPGDARLVRELLSELPALTIALAQADRLSSGLDYLTSHVVDVVLLDLTLPDSHGLETVQRVLEHAPGVPVVVMTMVDDESVAIRAVHAGAQDYLFKGQTDAHLLTRAIRYAIERQRLLLSLEESRRREQREREAQELRAMESFVQPVATSVTAQMFGLVPLREALPGVYGELVLRYGELLEQSLEKRTYRVDHNISESLRAVADQLGFLRAGPRDVVDIHTAAVRQKMTSTNATKVQAYVEESRLTVLELMGYMVLFYRNYSIGARRPVMPEIGAPPGARSVEET